LEANLSKGIEAVQEQVKAAKDPLAKQNAMRAMSLMAESKEPPIDAALKQYAQGETSVFRVHAAKLLKRRGDPAALASVIADLSAQLDATDVERKLQALAMLQFAGEPEVASKILPALQDPNGAVRRGAVFALSRFDDDAVHAALAPLLNDPDPSVQQAAQRILKTTQ
jgi:HEAT repeat protein